MEVLFTLGMLFIASGGGGAPTTYGEPAIQEGYCVSEARRDVAVEDSEVQHVSATWQIVYLMTDGSCPVPGSTSHVSVHNLHAGDTAGGIRVVLQNVLDGFQGDRRIRREIASGVSIWTRYFDSDFREFVRLMRDDSIEGLVIEAITGFQDGERYLAYLRIGKEQWIVKFSPGKPGVVHAVSKSTM